MSKEDEEATGDEIEVRREDQDKINKFSRLHQRELSIEDELKDKNVSSFFPSHLACCLAEPYAEGKGRTRRHYHGAGAGRRGRYFPVSRSRLLGRRTSGRRNKTSTYRSCSYKIGDAFFHVPLPQAQEMLGTSTTKLEQEISELEDKMGTIHEEMTQLKVELYARFGRTINLET